MIAIRPALVVVSLLAFGAPLALAHHPQPRASDYDEDEAYDDEYDEYDEYEYEVDHAPRHHRSKRVPAYRGRRGAPAPAVRAQAAPPAAPAASKAALDRPFALGIFASRWSGDYESGGIGAKIRWEPFSMLGVELHGQVLRNDTGNRRGRVEGERFDVPLGFSLYVPIDLFWGIRARGIAGLCAMLSLGEDITIQETSSDDIMLGAHVGAGLEFGIGSRLSIFADAIYQTYVGHDRDLNGWSTAIGQELEQVDSFQATLGVAFHL